VLSSARLACYLGGSVLLGTVFVPTHGFAQADLAEDKAFFVRAGYGIASYRTTGRASIAGHPVEAARVALSDVSFAALELGWRVTPEWSVSFVGGLPPTVALHGRGDFAPQAVLRKVTYGSVMLGAQYHPFSFGRFEPFVGGGLGYTFILRTRGGSMSELNIADNAGPFLQVGSQFHITDRLSAFVDARKNWLSFDAKGKVGPSPVRVSVDPDPVSVTLGLSYRF
jgi:outer membrane protein